MITRPYARGIRSDAKPAKVVDDDILTTREAAAFLKISERTLGKLTKAGELPAGRFGNQWRYSRRVLLAYAAGEKAV